MRHPLVLDANALISLFDGSDGDLERALAGAEELIVPIVAYAEVMAGADNGTDRARRTVSALRGLLSMPNTRVLTITETTSRYYVKIFNLLKRNGTPIPTNDIWIAAMTMEVGGCLFTRDEHFARIPLLDVQGLDSAY